ALTDEDTLPEDEALTDEDTLLDEETLPVLGTVSGKVYNQVEINETYTARALQVTLEDLMVGVATEGYAVSYAVDPVGGAVISGSNHVAEGEDLTFTVKAQSGYEVIGVTANGADLMAEESATESDAAAGKQSYTVLAVTEDLEVVVSMKENAVHPAFDQVYEGTGITIRVSAEEGILPEGTKLAVREVTEEVGTIVKEKVEAAGAEATTVTSVIAYDISLMLDGKKLDNSWSQHGYVTVNFSGEKIAQMSLEADKIEVLHVITPTTNVESANGGTAEEPLLNDLTAENTDVDNEGRTAVDVSAEQSVEAVGIETNHFTVFSLAAVSKSGAIVMQVGDEQTLMVDKDNRDNHGENEEKDEDEDEDAKYRWTVTTNRIIDITSPKRNKATIVAKQSGDTIVAYQTQGKYGWKTVQSYYIVVTSKKQLTVTFDANGGQGDDFGMQVGKDGTITTPENPFTREGYEFVGWHGQPDGHDSGNGMLQQTYAANTEYPSTHFSESSERITKDTTLYAVWLDADAVD
ncbi:MAG: InlB B-repeat-containing protein, partial [Hungatella sp.]